MVYPVGETAKLPDLVKNIREEDVPERFRVELRGVYNHTKIIFVFCHYSSNVYKYPYICIM